jgi:MoaA/NifB/PqqE/SkfB family radical SAM enzyme
MANSIGTRIRNALWKGKHLARAVRENLDTRERPWIRARNRHKTILDYDPINIFVEPTNICDLRCPMCPTGAGLTASKKGFLDASILAKILGELRHTPRTFGLWLAGEPLLHPQIVELIRMCAQKGVRPSLHTNATRLTPELAEQMIKAGLGEISFSFDGRTIEEYETLRKGAHFSAVLNNIQDFLRIKQQLGSPLPRVVIQNIEPYERGRHQRIPLHENVHELRQQFSGLPVDEFRTILAHSWSGVMENMQYVAPGHRKGRRWVCAVPYTDLTVNWRGEAVTCCGDFDAANVLGDVTKETIYELWNNERFQRFRAAMHTREIEYFPLCGQCERIWADPNSLDYSLRLELLRYMLRF